MILRLFEQDVQISGSKTGSLVSTTLRNHTAVRVSEGHDIGGTLFLGYFLWSEQQEVTRHRGENKIRKLLDSRFHGNDGC